VPYHVFGERNQALLGTANFVDHSNDRNYRSPALHRLRGDSQFHRT
jgi:hypothetical protein